MLPRDGLEIFVLLIFEPCEYYLLKGNIKWFLKCKANIFFDTNYTCVLKVQNHFLREGVYCQSKVVKNSDPVSLSYRPNLEAIKNKTYAGNGCRDKRKWLNRRTWEAPLHYHHLGKEREKKKWTLASINANGKRMYVSSEHY